MIENMEHLLDCLEKYQKGELTGEQVNEKLSVDEKVFLIMHQDLLEEQEDDYDVLDWLAESEGESFFMVVEADEQVCREAESVLDDLGIEMPVAIELFLKQLIETKELPLAATKEN